MTPLPFPWQAILFFGQPSSPGVPINPSGAILTERHHTRWWLSRLNAVIVLALQWKNSFRQPQNHDKRERPWRPQISVHYKAGIITLSMTWITPLLARTSTATIFACTAVVSVMVGGVPALMVIFWPATVATGVPNGIWVDST